MNERTLFEAAREAQWHVAVPTAPVVRTEGRRRVRRRRASAGALLVASACVTTGVVFALVGGDGTSAVDPATSGPSVGPVKLSAIPDRWTLSQSHTKGAVSQACLGPASTPCALTILAAATPADSDRLDWVTPLTLRCGDPQTTEMRGTKVALAASSATRYDLTCSGKSGTVTGAAWVLAAGAAVITVDEAFEAEARSVSAGLRFLDDSAPSAAASAEPTPEATPAPSSPSEVDSEDPEPLPGSTTTIELAAPVTYTGSGTDTVDLGERPAEATAANVSVVCLTAGTIEYPDGASTSCEAPASAGDIADPRSANYGLVTLKPGQTSLEFRAKPGVSWKVVASYVRTETSEWGVNANGETYGVERDGKTPDLVGVYATNGKYGYCYSTALDGPMPTSPADALQQQKANEGTVRSIPVYESDGRTVIGEFTFSPAVGKTGR